MQKRILDILQNTQKVIIGKERVTKLLLTALLADGHVLLEGRARNRENKTCQSTGCQSWN